MKPRLDAVNGPNAIFNCEAIIEEEMYVPSKIKNPLKSNSTRTIFPSDGPPSFAVSMNKSILFTKGLRLGKFGVVLLNFTETVYEPSMLAARIFISCMGFLGPMVDENCSPGPFS
jgi:hypothetical protein